MPTPRILAAVGYLPLAGLLILIRYYRDPYIARHALTGTLLTSYFCLAFLWQNDFRPLLLFFLAALKVSAFLQISAGQDFRLPLITDFTDYLFAQAFKTKQSNEPVSALIRESFPKC